MGVHQINHGSDALKPESIRNRVSSSRAESAFADLLRGSATTRLAQPAPEPKVSVVIPCHNERDGLDELQRRVSAVCASLVSDSYEIVLVDDGSTDGTWSRVLELVDTHTSMVGVNLSRNYGHQAALTAGLSICRGGRVLILDADLQDPPELLPEMMTVMDSGADVVYGVRQSRRGETRFKRLSAWLFYRLLKKFADVPIPPDAGDFRLLSRRAVDLLLTMPEQHRFVRGMVTWIGLRQVPLPYERHERSSGRTKYSFPKMLRFAVDAVTGFSTRPLRLAIHLGLLFTVGAMAALGYTMYSWLFLDTVQGWTSIMTTLLLLGGVQLLVLGVMGEYIGRIYTEVKGRPLFVIQDAVMSAPHNDNRTRTNQAPQATIT